MTRVDQLYAGSDPQIAYITYQYYISYNTGRIICPTYLLCTYLLCTYLLCTCLLCTYLHDPMASLVALAMLVPHRSRTSHFRLARVSTCEFGRTFLAAGTFHNALSDGYRFPMLNPSSCFEAKEVDSILIWSESNIESTHNTKNNTKNIISAARRYYV